MQEPNRTLDLVVIGSGPGGYVAAIRAAQLKLRVAVVERAELGGICANWGCIPTKALLHSAEVFSSMKYAADLGIQVPEVNVQFSQVIGRSRKVALGQSQGVGILLKKNHIQQIPGEAKIKKVAEDGVVFEVSGRSFFAKNVIIATGARPKTLPHLAPDREKILTYFEAMNLPKQPKFLAILGAGAIGVEFAYFYNTIGTKVFLFEAAARILPSEDEEISELLLRSLRKQGIEIFLNTQLQEAKKVKEGLQIFYTNEKNQKGETKVDQLLVSIGVQGNVENLGLEECGVKTERGFIQVDSSYRVFDKNKKPLARLFAIGDVIGAPMLAHKASAEGIACVEGISGMPFHEIRKVNYDTIPGAVFCRPEVASVGLSETKAKESGKKIKVGRFPFKASGKAHAMGETDGLVKTVVDAETGELLGAHIIGGTASDMISTMSLAKTAELTSTEILHTVLPHPTYGEVLKSSIESAYGEAIDL